MTPPLKTTAEQREGWAVRYSALKLPGHVFVAVQELIADIKTLLAANKALEEVVQEAYGLLWQVETAEQKIHHARRLLLSLIDKDGQRKGIANTRPLDCGHPISLGVISAETGDFLYCELCDARSAKNDAEKMEAEYKDSVDQLEQALKRVGEVTDETLDKAVIAFANAVWGESSTKHNLQRLVVKQGLRAALTAEDKALTAIRRQYESTRQENGRLQAALKQAGEVTDERVEVVGLAVFKTMSWLPGAGAFEDVGFWQDQARSIARTALTAALAIQPKGDGDDS